MKFYHNPRCGKSRTGLELLKGKDLEIIFYLKDIPSINEIKEICDKCGIKPQELIRTKEAKYKELVAEFGEPNSSTALKWLHEHPKLIERPILINGSKGRIGRPPEKLLEII